MSNRRLVRLMSCALLLCGIGIFSLLWNLPGGVKFSAPHQTSSQRLVSRLSLNEWLVARAAFKVLQVTIVPTVHAQTECSTRPNCNGQKAVPAGIIPWCWQPTFECAQYTCQYVGGQTTCGPYNYTCPIRGGPTFPCYSASDSNKCTVQ
jgi:hypothetical protein